jgi:predicted ATP-binding protein involved in virulence
MIGMVADVAFRCHQLNPHLGKRAALEAQGVILIDEVDMHLHPQWQQVILTQLQQAFPKLQFIVTTHSPQVLTTVPAKQIRMIKDVTPQGYVDKQYKVEVPDEETRGVTSGDILSQVMGTHPRPDILETQILSQYKALIQQNQYTTEPALALRQALNAHFGECHPQMIECERLIRLVEFKNKLSKREGGDA